MIKFNFQEHKCYLILSLILAKRKRRKEKRKNDIFFSSSFQLFIFLILSILKIKDKFITYIDYLKLET
jgi:hypothetical protein